MLSVSVYGTLLTLLLHSRFLLLFFSKILGRFSSSNFYGYEIV